MKRRFSMTLDPSLMHKIDLLVDGTRFTNRSQTAEFLLKLGIEQFRPERTALILCGGLEPRVKPTSFSTPKPLLPIGYQPLLEYQIEYLKRYEFDRIILAIGFLQEQIVRYLDERRLGIRLRYSFEKEPLDTGGAIKNAEALIVCADTCTQRSPAGRKRPPWWRIAPASRRQNRGPLKR